jgi:hypothetical protein
VVVNEEEEEKTPQKDPSSVARRQISAQLISKRTSKVMWLPKPSKEPGKFLIYL